MKSAVIALAAAVGLVSAQNAVVENHGSSTIYVQSWPFDQSQAPGPLTTVKPGEYFSEPFNYAGTTVKIAKTKTLDGPLFFGYSFDANNAYYNLNSKWGNPFADKHNTLDAGDGCDYFDCAPGDGDCYGYDGHEREFACPRPVTLTAKIAI